MANKITETRTLLVKLKPLELILTNPQDRTSHRKITSAMHWDALSTKRLNEPKIIASKRNKCYSPG